MSFIVEDSVARQLYVDCMRDTKPEDRSKMRLLVKELAPVQFEELLKVRKTVDGFAFGSDEVTRIFLTILTGMPIEDKLKVIQVVRENNPEGFAKFENHVVTTPQYRKNFLEFINGVKPEDRAQLHKFMTEQNPEGQATLAALKSKIEGEPFENEEFILKFHHVVNGLSYEDHVKFLNMLKQFNEAGWKKLHE
jgi:hypothetical protein